MKKGIFLATLVLLFCFVSPPAFAQEITVEPKGKGEWALYRKAGETNRQFATMNRTEGGGLAFHDASGRFIGIIQTSGAWVPWNARKRVTVIKPEEAELYLDVLEASKKLQ